MSWKSSCFILMVSVGPTDICKAISISCKDIAVISTIKHDWVSGKP